MTDAIIRRGSDSRGSREDPRRAYRRSWPTVAAVDVLTAMNRALVRDTLSDVRRAVESVTYSGSRTCWMSFVRDFGNGTVELAEER